MKIIKVTWVDAQRIELGVQAIEEVKDLKPVDCDIIGFEIYRDKNKIILAQEKWDEMLGVKYIHIIPMRSVKEVKELSIDKKEIDKIVDEVFTEGWFNYFHTTYGTDDQTANDVMLNDINIRVKELKQKLK